MSISKREETNAHTTRGALTVYSATARPQFHDSLHGFQPSLDVLIVQ